MREPPANRPVGNGGAPLVGVVFERLRPALLAIGPLLLAVSSVYFLTGNTERLLVSRRSVFIRTWAEQRVWHAGPAYVGAARFVMSTGCADVGLALGHNDREYFLWGTLADAGWRGRIEPVLVTNASAGLPDGPAVRSVHARSFGRPRAHPRPD
jgi:hypothetical protein